VFLPAAAELMIPKLATPHRVRRQSGIRPVQRVEKFRAKFGPVPFFETENLDE